jgi:hypothetical protein
MKVIKIKPLTIDGINHYLEFNHTSLLGELTGEPVLKFLPTGGVLVNEQYPEGEVYTVHLYEPGFYNGDEVYLRFNRYELAYACYRRAAGCKTVWEFLKNE